MIVSLTGYRPTPRTDQPWTQARIDEAPDETGPWTTIAEVPLEPVDVDPSEPLERDLTTTAATLEHGWYRVTFIDAEDGEEPTDPIPGDDVAAGLLAPLEDVKLYLHTQGHVSAGAKLDDGLLYRMLRAASWRMRQAVPDRTLSPMPPSPSAPPIERRFTPARFLQVPDLREVTEVRLDDRVLEATDYELVRDSSEPTAPAIYLRFRGAGLLTLGARELVVSGHWGPLSVRPHVAEACIVWVARVFHQRSARFADNASTGPEGLVVGYFRNLPPDVKIVLDGLWVPGL